MGFFFNGVFMLKKITIAVLGLSASGLMFAGTMGPACIPGNVTVPCAAELWELGADALYLTSIYGATKSNEVAINSQYKEVNSDWNWGYRLNGAYHFNTGNDVTINWTHFSSSVNQMGLAGSVILNPVVTLPNVPFQLISRNRMDQVNAVMGQHVDLGQRDKMRFYAGLQYANIQSNAQSYYTSAIITGLTGYSLSKFDNTDYKGYGPSFGIDYSYNITEAFSLTANGSGSILYGTTRYHAGNVFNPVGAIPLQVYASKKAIVPSLEAKLGVNYAYNLSQGVVNIDAGYQVINYFNPLTGQNPQLTYTPRIDSVNYGVYGPYFGLKYVGNA